MLTFHLKILLRYRQALIIPIPVILGIIFVRYYFFVSDLTHRTTILFVLLLFFSIGDIYLSPFYGVSDEIRKYTLLPITLHSLILYKNISVALISTAYIFLISTVIILIYHQPISTFVFYLTYSLTIIFPFLSIGNIIFSSIPQMNKAHQSVMRTILGMLIVCVLSLPFVIIKFYLKDVLYIYLYIASGLIVWRYLSIGVAGKQLLRNINQIGELQ
jgi:hypothetical protein